MMMDKEKELTPEEVDDILRQAGYDPYEVGKGMQAAAMRGSYHAGVEHGILQERKRLKVLMSSCCAATILWCWKDAPEEYKKLSGHGGDEDWVIFIPKDMAGWSPFLIMGDYLTGFGWLDSHELDSGDWVIICAHS